MDKELFQVVRSPSFTSSQDGRHGKCIHSGRGTTFLLLIPKVAEFQMLSFSETNTKVCGQFLSFVVFSHFSDYQQRCVIISILACP